MVAGIRLPEHSHCKYCGDPISFGEEYCNEVCQRAEFERADAEKRKEYLFWGSALLVCAVVIVVAVVAKFSFL